MRCSASNWVQKESDPIMHSLKENNDFSVSVKFLDDTLSVVMKCIPCGTTVQLQPDCNKPGCYILSNWTRHVKSCKEIAKRRKQPPNANSLHKYFLTKGTGTGASNTQYSGASNLNASPKNTANSSVTTTPQEPPLSNAISTSTVKHNEHVLASFNCTSHVEIGHFESSDTSCTDKTSVLDWSRDGRRQRIIEATGSDPNQL